MKLQSKKKTNDKTNKQSSTVISNRIARWNMFLFHSLISVIPFAILRAHSIWLNITYSFICLFCHVAARFTRMSKTVPKRNVICKFNKMQNTNPQPTKIHWVFKLKNDGIATNLFPFRWHYRRTMCDPNRNSLNHRIRRPIAPGKLVVVALIGDGDSMHSVLNFHFSRWMCEQPTAE